MKHTQQLFYLLLLSVFTVFAGYSADLDSLLAKTGLPVLYISTVNSDEPQGEPAYPPAGAWGVGLTDNEYVSGSLTIEKNGEVLYSSGEYNAGASGIRIKLRGNTSALGNGKKPYKLKLSKKCDMLFRGSSIYRYKDWVLLPAHDRKCIKTITGFILGNSIGAGWEPGFEFVSLVINGDYKGFYLLTDAVEKNTARIEIDNTGFVIEDDAYWWNEDVYFKGNILPYPVGYTFKYPDSDDITQGRLSDIRQYILDFEELLLNNSDISSMIDVESFATWLLAHDILGSGDSGGTNRYLYKYDMLPGNFTSSLMKMGILWDFDAAFKNEGKWAAIHNVDYSFYFPYLLDNNDFIKAYYCKWEEVKGSICNKIIDSLHSIQHEKGEGIELCKMLDTQRWHHTNPTFASDVQFVENWLDARIAWLEENISEAYSSIGSVPSDDIKEQSIYTIYGVKVSEMNSPGIYIVNGRKVLVK